ncbi:MAG: AAA family ATPase [Saprospiraceae bacterium]|nr:AAA family ATPase [Saprospiraceae bacterium]MCB9323085.1 AAA family ATPase [Lewinellaceae bacterium]
MQQELQKTTPKLYKFKDLKVYTSTEWLADNRKKYRQVFDRYETAYVYAELSFYNKLFDQEDWDINVQMHCFDAQNKKKVCELSFDRKVNKYDSVVYIREGWGNKTEGSFWKRGTYYWKAWINEEKVATKFFYIEDAGEISDEEDNPYVDIQGVKLYEGPYDDVNADDRVYMKSFSSEETRYVYVELNLKNLYTINPWHCELFIKFYNGSKELKGQLVRLQSVEKDAEEIHITAGWGSDVKESWRIDHYTAEIIFMDRLLATVPFRVGEEFEEGIAGVILPQQQAPVILTPDLLEDRMTFEEVMSRMDNLIGLKEIKNQVRNHAKYIKFLQLRKQRGFEEKENINVHSVFIGNPGTGKTTVASMMGKLYKKMGLLTKGHVHEVDRVDLVGEYIGQTAPKVKEAIEKARGGVLFIDEAYSLARSREDNKDFGREVIEILVKEMSDGKGDMAVIVAGYPREMKLFLDTNPGLKSRFKLFFEFSDYLPQELSQIAEYACKEKDVVLTLAAKKKIDKMIVRAYRSRGRSFGNARFVYDLIEKSKINLGLRIMAMESHHDLEKAELATIQLQDVDKIEIEERFELPDIPIDEALLTEALAELNSLIGMEKVKIQINEMVSLVRYYRQTEKDVLNKFFLHTVFIGNPGTGKTTVARILTKIYKALGVLERGHMIETDRQGLVAGYVGQTAIKTAEKIEESMGGVLFIDEAYSLMEGMSGGRGGFGDEAIQTLLKRMEDHRGQFFVFVAGYPDNMEAFLKANPGLNSRFDKTLRFDDYSPQDLYQIGMHMLTEEKLIADSNAEKHLENYFAFLHNYRDKYFGNARTVRNVIQEVIKAHNLRLAAMDPEERAKIPADIITIEDASTLKTDKSDFVFNKKTMGFGKG